MSLFRPFRGSRVNLDSIALHDGYAYFCVDDGTFHIDYTDENGDLKRKQISAKDAETLAGMTVDEIMATSQSDWSINDESNPGFVKNRTHWVEMSSEVVTEETTVTTSNNKATLNYAISFVPGNTYNVHFDGSEYECVARAADYNGYATICVGNGAGIDLADTGEPFGIYTISDMSITGVWSSGEDGDYTFSISTMSKNYHLLDSEYLDYMPAEDARDIMLDCGLIEPVYGVEWVYGSSTLARTNAAIGFADPVPAEDLESIGSSPFDNLMPWAGMKRYNVIDGAISYSEDDEGFSTTDYDTVVYIPEFYYRIEKDVDMRKWRWIISPQARNGYVKHPGSGRYVGRYHTTGTIDAATCISGGTPIVRNTRDNFRQASHAKGDNWWMLDLASWSAIQLLYLVEYATWDSQSALGQGQTSGSVVACGGTDGAVYHSVKRTGESNQYRWMEDLWSNVFDFIDGVTYSSGTAYVGTDNSNFSDTVDALSNTNITGTGYWYPRGLAFSDVAPWAFIPGSDGEDSPSIPDYAHVLSGVRVVCVGGYFDSYPNCGLFFCYANSSASYTYSDVGARLLFVP